MPACGSRWGIAHTPCPNGNLTRATADGTVGDVGVTAGYDTPCAVRTEARSPRLLAFSLRYTRVRCCSTVLTVM